ncbi:MAG: hypothetical protein Kow0013_09560 [Pararhodobacter sp.]
MLPPVTLAPSAVAAGAEDNRIGIAVGNGGDDRHKACAGQGPGRGTPDCFTQPEGTARHLPG